MAAKNMEGSIRVDLLQQWPPEAATADAWSALAEQRENLFLSPQWLGAWLTVAKADRPLVLVARDGCGEVLGVLPLVRAPGRGVRALRFPAAQSADILGVACGHGRAAAVVEACGHALGRLRPRWHAIALDRLEEERIGRRLARALDDDGVRLMRRDGDAVLPFIDLSAGHKGWLAGLKRNVRNEIKRRPRRLAEAHRVHFRCAASPNEVARDMETLLSLHARRWADRGGSEALPPATWPFHRAFAQAAFARGWLRLWVMELDGEAVAAWYGWRCGERYCYYQSGFDPAWKEAAVGTVLLTHTIESAAGEGASVYDFLWGDEAHKQRFATGQRNALSFVLIRNRTPAGAAVGAGVIAADAARRRLPPGVRAPLRRAYRGLMRR